MDENATSIISAIVAIAGPVITIVGFVVSYFAIRTTFKNDVRKIQKEKIYSKIEDLPYEFLKIMQNIFDSKDDQEKMLVATKKLFDLEYKIVAYGSKDAIKICCYIQERSFSSDIIDPFETMAAFGLLISQLKKDLTDEIMLPDVFYRITIKDYAKCGSRVVNFSNDIVDKIELDEGFRIK